MITIDYKKARRLLETNDDLSSKLTHHNNLVLEFDGIWFDLSNIVDSVIVGNFFFGENEITENIEGYINLFVNNQNTVPEIARIINAIKETAEVLRLTYDIDFLYVKSFTAGQEIQLKLINAIQNEETNIRFLSYVVNKIINSCSIGKKNENLIIRTANEKDLDNVINCLVQAYLNGTLPEMYKKIGVDRFKQNIRTYYTKIIDDDNLILVGEINGEFCGHISYSLDEMDYFGGSKQAKLIDIFVLKKFSGLNIGSTLVRVGEQECYNRGINTIIGTVDNDIKNPGKTLKILNQLKKDSWKTESFIFLC